MNVIRVTVYPATPSGVPDSFEPMTVVVEESSLRDDLTVESAAAQFVADGDTLGLLTIIDAFEVEDGSELVAVTARAMERAAEREQIERYQACLYHYEARALRIAAPNAILAGTLTAPIGVEDASYALRRLAAHPDYEHQTVVMPVMGDPIAPERVIVRMQDGEISVEAVNGEGDE